MLTAQQRALLELVDGYTQPPSTRQLADRLERPQAGSAYVSYHQVYACARRLERRGLLARPTDADRPVRWTITDAGRHASG